jgi:hypothetical protein
MSDLSFSRTRILQSPSNALYHTLSKLILTFAVLGYTDVASRLLSKLNTHAKHHGMDVVLRRLWLLWDTVDAWPEGERERVRDLIKEERNPDPRTTGKEDGEGKGEELKKKAAKREKDQEGDAITDEDVRNRIDDLASYYAGYWMHPPVKGTRGSRYERDMTSLQKLESIENVLARVEGLEPDEYRHSRTGAMAMNVSSALVSALNLKLSPDDTQDVEPLPSAEAILGLIAKRLSANCQIQYLAESRHAWRILKDGALAKVLKLNTKKATQFIKEFEQVIDERFSNGKLNLNNIPMRQLLEKLEDLTLNDPSREANGYTPRTEKTIFQEPATVAEIAETEKRLNIELPEDYKEFLSLTNGFGQFLSEPPLHPARKLRWLDDSEDYFTDLMLDMLDNSFLTTSSLTVGKAIEIGTEDIDNQWLVPPSTISAFKAHVRKILDGSEVDGKLVTEDVREAVRQAAEEFAGSLDAFWQLEWCCLTWASGGSALMLAYPSFKKYLQSVLWEAGRSEEDLVERRGFWGYAFAEVVGM